MFLTLNNYIEDLFFTQIVSVSVFLSSNLVLEINNTLNEISCSFFLLLIFIIILIISILTILVFVSEAKTVISVKMDNLPNSGNSNNDNGSNESSRKRKSDDSGNEGSSPKCMKVGYFEREKEKYRNIYKIKINNKYEPTRTGRKIEYGCPKEELYDTFDDLYTKYVEYRKNGIDIKWDRLSEANLVTYEKYPLGNRSQSWLDLDNFYQDIFKKMDIASDKYTRLQSKNKSTLFVNENKHIGSNIKNLLVDQKSKQVKDSPENFSKYIEIIESIRNKK